MQINLLLLNWYLLGVEMSFGHAHKTRFWYLLGVFSKFSDEHPRHFYRGVGPPPGPLAPWPPGVSWASNPDVFDFEVSSLSIMLQLHASNFQIGQLEEKK